MRIHPAAVVSMMLLSSRTAARATTTRMATLGTMSSVSSFSSAAFAQAGLARHGRGCRPAFRVGRTPKSALSTSLSMTANAEGGDNDKKEEKKKTKKQTRKEEGAKGGGRKGKQPEQRKEKNLYAPTILLPETSFSQRANAAVREPELQSMWEEMDLYGRLSSPSPSSSSSSPLKDTFVLHDGPPYANGDLHIGHALNKFLKDFVNRHQCLSKNKYVRYVPGWDCHGLPIELKVLQSMKSSERSNLTPVTLREKAASFAKATVESQSSSFRRYGILGDFHRPYLTLQAEFESAQIQVFGEMYKRGFIFRGRKPVHWSPSSRTALAEAELEYPEGHISRSIYVAFPLVGTQSDALKPYLDSAAVGPAERKEEARAGGIKVAVWTTTPWTMPANMAVAVNPDLDYSVVHHPSTGTLVVATDLIETLEKKLLPSKDNDADDNDDDDNADAAAATLPSSFEVLATVKGLDVAGSTYQHPLYTDRTLPVLAGGDYITTESGTGLVHTAPGHGQEDYLTGLKHGLQLLSPVDDVGKFTTEAGERFVGMDVLGQGNLEVICALEESGALLLEENYRHKYPYDWRTKKPTIFRATDQWFASVEGFRDDAMKAVDTVRWVPEIGKNRITSFVSGRGDWCISRQRSWGVPIPVFYDRDTGKEVLLDEHTLEHIKSLFSEHGSDCWWTMNEEQLLPERYRSEASRWKKGTDTMDVWFDSGSSWAGVLKGREELSYPADLYLEGSDQHRGWFQSSLLTSVAAEGRAPYKTVLTHGFVLDEKGYKMSKSLGNVVDPMKVIEGGNNKKLEPAYGADVLRLWVASVDYTGDVCIGSNIIKQTFESYRKLRNTARYLLGNLADFTPPQSRGGSAASSDDDDDRESNAVPYDDLPSMDKWMLGRLSSVLREVDDAMDEYQFNRASQELLRFASADLSNFYLDVAKDRLYISAVNDARRRSCQTVLHACLTGFAKALAPILPHMAEDIWQNLPYDRTTDSVFEGGFPPELRLFPETDADVWDLVRDLRDDVNKALEVARADKLVGASLDAAACVYAPGGNVREILDRLSGDRNLIDPPVKTNGVDDLRTTLMISQINLVDSEEDVLSRCDERYVVKGGGKSGCTIGVMKAAGSKCGRCWFYDEQVGKMGLPRADLCQRCDRAISAWEEATGKTFEMPEMVAVEEAAAAAEPVA